MLKNFFLRIKTGREKLKDVNYKIAPVIVAALFLTSMIICVAAAEIVGAPEQEETSLTSEEALTETAPEETEKIVERAKVTVTYGEKEYVTCSSPIITVGELLGRLKIETGENTKVNAPLDSLITDGMILSIEQYTKTCYTEVIATDFGTAYENSQTVPKGKTALAKDGVPGKKLLTREVTYVNGEMISDEIIGEEIIEKAVDAVYYRGVGGAVTSNDGTVYNYSYYIDVIATAYHTGGITATGHAATEEVVAVDPKVIPYGTKMFITGKWGEVGYRSAEDCGNFRGNRIDVCMEGTREELLQFGKRNMRVYILE